jgi:hypothetical protein
VTRYNALNATGLYVSRFKPTTSYSSLTIKTRVKIKSIHIAPPMFLFWGSELCVKQVCRLGKVGTDNSQRATCLRGTRYGR